MGNAVAVAQHFDRRTKPRQLDLAFGLRQRLPQEEVSPCASKTNKQQGEPEPTQGKAHHIEEHSSVISFDAAVPQLCYK
jgi:hypothetical protein